MNFVHKWSERDTEPGSGTAGAIGADSPPRMMAAIDGPLVVLVLANLWWTTLCLGGYRPDSMPVTVTLNAVAVLAWLARETWRQGGLRLNSAALAVLPFLAYALMSAGWITPVPWLGWWDWLNWAQMAVVFVVVSHGIRGPRAREVLFWGVITLGVVAVVMAAYQRLADPGWLMLGRRQAPQYVDRSSGPFGIPNSLAGFLNLLLPPMLALVFRRGARPTTRILGAYLAALFACGLLLTLSRGAWLAMGAALIAWPLLAVQERSRRWRLAGMVAVVLAAAGGLVFLRDTKAHERVDALLRHPLEPSRTVMWRAGWRLFAAHPFLGTGAGSYAVMFERHRPERFWDAPRWTHNDYLNTLSDYGAIGFLLSFGVVAVAGWRTLAGLRRGPEPEAAGGSSSDSGLRPFRAGIVVGLLAFAVQLIVDFNLKIPALAQAAAIMAGLLVPPPAEKRRPASGRMSRVAWIAPAMTAVVVIVGVPAWVLPLCRAEAVRYQARQTLDRLAAHPPGEADLDRGLRDARATLARAVEIDPRNAAAWSDLADALIQQSRVTPAPGAELGREAEAAATRALELSQVVAEFWVRRGLARDLQGKWRDAWADFAQALELAPHRADLWYYYAYHLSLRDLESARTALATCLRLDPWNSAALAFQKQLRGSH